MGCNKNIILPTLKRDKVNQVRVDMGNPGLIWSQKKFCKANEEGKYVAGSARGNKDLNTYMGLKGAGVPPVCGPWCNRASGIPQVNLIVYLQRHNPENVSLEILESRDE